MSKKYCKSCDWELDDWEKEYPTLHKDNVVDFNLAKKYCDEHETIYGDKCRPIWCRSCKHLKIYQITLTEKSRKMTPNFDKKRK